MRPSSKFTVLLVGLALMVATAAIAAPPVQTPPPAQFDVEGFVQEATLDTTGAICTPTDPLLAGGTITINGQKIIVPCNTILQLPATSMTWAQLFDPASSAAINNGQPNHPSGQTGLAISDSPPPYPTFEARVIGNILVDPGTGEPRYIAGLVIPVTQKNLMDGLGIINYIDYDTGRLRVGGKPGDPNTGALVEINDPVGRFGLAHSPDPRFTSDTNNPTVHTDTGYPVGIPKVAPTGAPGEIGDPDRPYTNRPRNGDPLFAAFADPYISVGAPLRRFDMPAPGTPGYSTDPTKQVPLMVGDWISYSGTLYRINPDGPSTPDNMYVSAHTLVANLGIFTAPGVPPCYVSVEDVLLGTQGPTIPDIPQENKANIKVEGFTSDPSRPVDIFAVDVNPCTGVETLRKLGTADPAAQPVRGRFRLILNGGLFMPPTRELMVRSQTGVLRGVANGLDAGQYRLPDFDFIFPENVVFGQPLVPNNFQDFQFLAQGSGPLGGAGSGGPIVGQLDPWPGSPAPPKSACATNGFAPVVSAGPDFTVGSGDQVTLGGVVTLDPSSSAVQYTWVQTAGPGVALSGFSTLTPSFTAPTLAPGKPSAVLTFKLTATDQFGSGSSSVSVTVLPLPDVIVAGAAIWKAKTSTLTLKASSNAAKALLTVDAVKAADGTIMHLGAMAPGRANKAGRKFKFKRAGTPKPVSLTIRSTLGGSVKASVTVK